MARPHPDKMTFLEHLEELRQRLVRACVYLALGFAACWGFREQIFHFMVQPMRKAGFTEQVHLHRAGRGADALHEDGLLRGHLPGRARASSGRSGASSRPGLYKNEKKWAVPFIGMGTLFFAGGALFGHYFLFPLTFQFLYTFGGPDMQFMPQIGEYWSFYSWFLLGLGLVFQIPVVIFVLVAARPRDRRASCCGCGSSRSLGSFVVVGGHHADPRRGHPDGARRADDRPLPARGARGLALREEARARRPRVQAGIRPSAVTSAAPVTRVRQSATVAPTTAFSRRAWPAFSSTT